MNVLIPMAGMGSRFSSKGYTDPKPVINFLGKTMIEHVIEHLGLFDYKHIFICQKSHVKKYKLRELFQKILFNNFDIIEIDGLTEGAACSVLTAKKLINNDIPLMIVNSDQLIHWNPKIIEKTLNSTLYGLIFCFYGNGPNWSYVRVNEYGDVIEVAEKIQISNFATSGMYYWRRGSDFVFFAEEMIKQNIRVNNEFYVAPVYNQAIKNGAKIKIQMVDDVDQIGTPEELEKYLLRHG